MQLLSPVQIGSIEVRNRVVSTAHGSFLEYYRPGIDGERYEAYQERRAKGGAGLIILQPVHVHPSSHALGHFPYEPDDLRRKLTSMADRIHRHGGKVFQQLIHFGGQFTSNGRTAFQPIWAFDDLVTAEGEGAHKMTGVEIEEVLDAFAATAAIAIESGIDGVELHGTHGYLLQQSFSPWGNRRDDEWGDQFAFGKALIERVRARIGREPVVGLRISTDDFLNPERGGLGQAGLRHVAKTFVGTGGLDYVNQSEGSRTGHYARTIGNFRHRLGEFLPLAHKLRDEIEQQVPIIAASRVNDPVQAEAAIANGDCDLVAMTRGLIADPDLVEKTSRGVHIRHCVGANQGCVDRMVAGLPITCFHNPDVGRETQGEPTPTTTPKHVVVVGGGPAGLKAAEIAARRGHTVTLYEREQELGGRLRWVRGLGDAAELYRSIEWLEGELASLGVTVNVGVEAGEPELASADVVVLATGARPAPDRLGVESDGSIPVLSIDEALAQPTFTGAVLFVDLKADSEAALTAEHIARNGAKLTIATPYLNVGQNLGFTHLADVIGRYVELGVEMESSTAFAGIAGGLAVTRNVYTKEVRERPFTAIVASVHGRSDTSLAGAAERSGAQLIVIGDANAPRTAMHAFREGDDAGRAA